MFQSMKIIIRKSGELEKEIMKQIEGLRYEK